MSKVIAIGNNKGGVAKTTTAVNLAKGLADAGMRVLLIDADPQGNATAAVGFDEPDMIEENLATAMQKIIKDEDMVSRERSFLKNIRTELLNATTL